MLKKLSISISFILVAAMLLCSSFSAFAMGPTENGVYEVTIEMRHAEKDKTSMGNGYIAHTALLTVDGSEKTLTVAPNQTTDDMQLWYYKDGSVSGDTVEVEQKSGVEIGGEKYDTAFEFPIKSDNEYVGVKFAASAMPLSPSARIKIDYSSAKKVADLKKETTANANASTSSAAQSTTVAATGAAASESTGTNKNTTAIAVGAAVAVAAVALIIVVIKKKSN